MNGRKPGWRENDGVSWIIALAKQALKGSFYIQTSVEHFRREEGGTKDLLYIGDSGNTEENERPGDTVGIFTM